MCSGADSVTKVITHAVFTLVDGPPPWLLYVFAHVCGRLHSVALVSLRVLRVEGCHDSVEGWQCLSGMTGRASRGLLQVVAHTSCSFFIVCVAGVKRSVTPQWPMMTRSLEYLSLLGL